MGAAYLLLAIWIVEVVLTQSHDPAPSKGSEREPQI